MRAWESPWASQEKGWCFGWKQKPQGCGNSSRITKKDRLKRDFFTEKLTGTEEGQDNMALGKLPREMPSTSESLFKSQPHQKGASHHHSCNYHCYWYVSLGFPVWMTCYIGLLCLWLLCMALSCLSLALCGAFHSFIYWLMSSVCTEAGLRVWAGTLTDLLGLLALTVNPRLLSGL